VQNKSPGTLPQAESTCFVTGSWQPLIGTMTPKSIVLIGLLWRVPWRGPQKWAMPLWMMKWLAEKWDLVFEAPKNMKCREKGGILSRAPAGDTPFFPARELHPASLTFSARATARLIA
jgi:hypothetical protein